MKLPSLPFVVLDTETTGFVPRVHKVIEFASIRCAGGKERESFEQLFSTEEIPPVVQAITHISPEDLRSKPSFSEKRDDILAAIGDDTLLVGQNTLFDLGMLKGEGIDLTSRPWVDTAMLASLVFPELESYSLGYVSTVLRLNHEPKHRALGDVRATLELFSKCWERLLALPQELEEATRAIAARAPEGYRSLFDVLPKLRSKKKPTWLALPEKRSVHTPTDALHHIEAPSVGEIFLQEDCLDPDALGHLMLECLSETAHEHWIAVKNLETTLARTLLPTGVRILHPPSWLPDPSAIEQFALQTTFTADEATLALKLAWYEPKIRSDIPIHGGEKEVWQGKISCTERSPLYTDQFASPARVTLVDHRQLLNFLADPAHAAHGALHAGTHIVITDASMLEDTATKAYGDVCPIEELRAAASGDALLTKLTDLLQLWIEKTRAFQDVRYIVRRDLETPETKGLRETLQGIKNTSLPPQVLRQLEALSHILDPGALDGKIAWIEQRQNGDQVLSSVPERIGEHLQKHLFSPFSVTLVIPPGRDTPIPEIFPPGGKTQKQVSSNQQPATLPISFPEGMDVETFLREPPEGKTILLINSRGAIEKIFVEHAESLEKSDVLLLCQGTSGGQSRMQAEFLAVKRAILVMTPWMFEGMLMPRGSVDRVILSALPFDHPSHTVMSIRAKHYRNAFNEYALERLTARMFRILRTFAGMRNPTGEVFILDERIATKEYGKIVRAYIEQFKESGALPPTDVPLPSPNTQRPKRKAAPKDQLSMF